MKLNNTQIKALAQEILNKIPTKEPKFTKEQLTKYTKIVNKFKELEKQIDKLNNEQNIILKKVKESVLFHYIYTSDLQNIEKLESRLILKDEKPTLDQIIQKITLETIFETKESLTDFIDKLVKEYTK